MDFQEVEYFLTVRGFVLLRKMWADVFGYSGGLVSERYLGYCIFITGHRCMSYQLASIAGDCVISKENS